MDLHQAYSILGLSDGASKEEVTAAFRKLAKEHHPDRNPDKPEAEDKFKEINSAYQFLTNPPKQRNFNAEVDMRDFMRSVFHYGTSRRMRPTIPTIDVLLTFNESILGCERKVNFNHFNNCNDCRGLGLVFENESCLSCGGSGMKRSGGNMNVMIMQSCELCGGSGKKSNKCSTCDGEGGAYNNIERQVKVPPGVRNNSRVNFGPFILRTSVDKDPDMYLDEHNGLDVISTIDISLLDALKGITKTVRTVKGDMHLKVKPGIRNNEKICAKGYGVAGKGNHIFNVDIKYPEDVSKIISVLEEE